MQSLIEHLTPPQAFFLLLSVAIMATYVLVTAIGTVRVYILRDSAHDDTDDHTDGETPAAPVAATTEQPVAAPVTSAPVKDPNAAVVAERDGIEMATTDWHILLFAQVTEYLTTAMKYADRPLLARLLTLRAADLGLIVQHPEIATQFANDVADIAIVGQGASAATSHGTVLAVHVADKHLADYGAAVAMATDYANALCLAVRWPEGEEEDYILTSESLDEASDANTARAAAEPREPS
jgi:hypothetical protein